MDKDKAQEFFKHEVSDYKSEHYGSGYRTFMSVRQEAFLDDIDKLNLPAASIALDAGCGPGLLTKELFDRGLNMYCLDTSGAMLNLAKSQYTEQDSPLPEFTQGNIESIPFDENHFNLLVSAGVIEYLKTDDTALSEFHRVLKKDGFLILSVTNSLSPIGILEGLIEWIKRNDFTRGLCNQLLSAMGRTPVRAREFEVRKHHPANFDKAIERNGFSIIKSGYFYMLPWPHPFDRIFPNASSLLGNKIESISNSRFGWLSEGYYVVAEKK